ncbi:MAG: hypothetical protein M3541_09435 [Acidobacteriota bacterium]|nr:hypothetical protein [Acidobacteriota bacterium]
MSRTIMLTVLVIAGLAYVTERGPHAEPQKPVKHRTLHIDGGPGTPSNLEGLWEASPLIVDATIRHSRPADRVLKGTSPEGFSLVQSAHELVLNEVFRDIGGATTAGKRIEVRQIGGNRDRGTYVESVDDDTFPRLRKGERYVFFLRPSPDGDGTYVTATNTADSALLLAEDATVRPRGNSEVARHLQRYNREELLNLLRNMKEAQR